MDEKTRDNVAENEIERMEDLGQALEESYAHMGNGEYDTDTLLAWEKINEYKEAGTILPVTISGIVNKGVIALVEGVRGFIPVSRLDINHVEDTLDWLGNDISGYLQPLVGGASMGVISEAGCPAVADPGADVVAIAQRKKLKVVPLVGPSSIILSVMASGFNGQSFAFHGYLPIEPGERAKKLKALEQRVYAENQTQLFIETPYRNHKMVEDILLNCRPQTKLCIAANITCEGEYIQTRTVKDWKGHVPDLSKIPCIFLLYK